MTKTTTLALIGMGSVFDDICANWQLVGKGRTLLPLRMASMDHATADTAALLADLDPAQTRIFAAVDSLAINHARLDVYAKARLMGFRGDSLCHPTAIMASGIHIGENCWIGAGAVISHAAKIGNNTMVGAATRIEAGVTLGDNSWIGAGASIGAGSSLGKHCLIGNDVHIASHLKIGRHCVIDVPAAYRESLPDGFFIDPLFPSIVRLFG